MICRMQESYLIRPINQDNYHWLVEHSKNTVVVKAVRFLALKEVLLKSTPKVKK